ncbi:proline-rich protein 11-like [Anneissia japonica]|uniref:proline-rich protein 11-like n=1 Tax=Anneissia japonica TaxID=1529436 RepID=UPI001425ADCB|nr:proline-rich protein 11-like [Anneissia japonica]XP_033126639.1 proline-rich protein 11-like [Anneissia japonica]
MRHQSKCNGWQSNAQKKRKYRQIKKQSKLNAARRVDAGMHSFSNDKEEFMSSSLNCGQAPESTMNVPEIDATNWIGSLANIPLNFIPSAFTGIYKRCIWAVGQSLEKAKDVVFPTRTFRRELESTQLKVMQLEQSLAKILEEKDTKTDAKCNCCSRSVRDSMSESSFCTLLNSTHPAPALQMVPPPPNFAPPPPGLPPPPPPPPPPPVKEVKQVKIVINKVKQSENTKSVKRLHISSNDLRKVKLRRVSHNDNKETPKSVAGGPLVSLKDLQKVKLRRLSLGSNLSPASQQVLRKRLPQEAVKFRSSLKKVSIARSPGGTPFRTHLKDHGNGLTPVMTRALKKKFMKARTPSPVPAPMKPLRF